jgi:hypothetical protein
MEIRERGNSAGLKVGVPRLRRLRSFAAWFPALARRANLCRASGAWIVGVFNKLTPEPFHS